MPVDVEPYLAIRRRAEELRSLQSLHIDITPRCNLSCVHCYYSKHQGQELGIDQFDEILAGARRLGALFVTFSGGEPTMRGDFWEILARARFLRYLVRIITNGQNIGAVEVDRLKRLGIASVGISLYSTDHSIHDRITCVPGSCRKTMRAIELLARAGLYVQIKTMLMEANWESYPRLREWARKLGDRVDCQYDPILNRRDDGDRTPEAMTLPETRLEECYRAIKETRTINKGQADPTDLSKPVCSAGRTMLYIHPTGKVFPCIDWRVAVGDLREQSIAEIWESSPELEKIRSLTLRDFTTCSTCPLVSVCPICPGQAAMHDGNTFTPSPAVCRRVAVATRVFGAPPDGACEKA